MLPGITSTIGIIVAKVIQLGSGTTEFLDEAAQVETVTYNFIDNMVSWIPENIVDAMATANMLQIIVFAIFLGVALLSLGEKSKCVHQIHGSGQRNHAEKLRNLLWHILPLVLRLCGNYGNSSKWSNYERVIAFIVS